MTRWGRILWSSLSNSPSHWIKSLSQEGCTARAQSKLEGKLGFQVEKPRVCMPRQTARQHKEYIGEFCPTCISSFGVKDTNSKENRRPSFPQPTCSKLHLTCHVHFFAPSTCNLHGQRFWGSKKKNYHLWFLCWNFHIFLLHWNVLMPFYNSLF